MVGNVLILHWVDSLHLWFFQVLNFDLPALLLQPLESVFGGTVADADIGALFVQAAVDRSQSTPAGF